MGRGAKEFFSCHWRVLGRTGAVVLDVSSKPQVKLSSDKSRGKGLVDQGVDLAEELALRASSFKRVVADAQPFKVPERPIIRGQTTAQYFTAGGVSLETLQDEYPDHCAAVRTELGAYDEASKALGLTGVTCALVKGRDMQKQLTTRSRNSPMLPTAEWRMPGRS
jgi:hypothetical protein